MESLPAESQGLGKEVIEAGGWPRNMGCCAGGEVTVACMEPKEDHLDDGGMSVSERGFVPGWC